MNAPKPRADDLLEAWTRATAAPTPVFAARPQRRRRGGAVALVAIAVAVLVGLLAGAFVVGQDRNGRQTRDPKDLAASMAAAIATAPGVRYAVSITTPFNDVGLSVNSAGVIDFVGGRFSGTADGGGGDAMMLMFGGPTRGAMVHLPDSLYIQTDGGPWERVPDLATFPEVLADRARLSSALEAAIATSQVDPTVRLAQCGAEACQVVAVALSAEALGGLELFVFGDTVTPMPPDLGPVVANLYFDPTGFPVRMETRFAAGTTVTTVTLQLARLDPAPSIAPPIP